jgi:hypothetical protein
MNPYGKRWFQVSSFEDGFLVTSNRTRQPTLSIHIGRHEKQIVLICSIRTIIIKSQELISFVRRLR